MTNAAEILPERRRPKLRALLASGTPVRAIECHSALSALVAERAAHTAPGGTTRRFDALWASGFAGSTVMGLPDAELFLHERRMERIAEIASASTLPIIADGDTGGDELAFALLCRRLEALGVSAVVVEDKAGAKRTSLADGVEHELEEPARFVEKITAAKQAVATDDFLVFARTEALIAGAGHEEALRRARAYLASAADGVVVHSKEKAGDEILRFMEGYRALQAELGLEKPLVLIPTAYNGITGAELVDAGARIIIHGNHLVRAAFRAMEEAACLILEHDRSLEADAVCAPTGTLFEGVGVGR